MSAICTFCMHMNCSDVCSVLLIGDFEVDVLKDHSSDTLHWAKQGEQSTAMAKILT